MSRGRTSNERRSLASLSPSLWVAFLGLALGACDGAQRGGDGRSVSVRFPIPIVEAGQTPFYVAVDRGYYAEEGLEVRLELGSRELNPVKMVATGEDTFGVLGGPDTLLVARSRAQPLTALAILHRNSNFPVFLTLESSGLTRLEQLEGRKVGFFYGHISTDVLRNLLRREQVDVEEVDVGFDYNQLIAGRVAAQWAFTVTAGLELPWKGTPVNFIEPQDYGIVSHGYTIFTRDDVVESRPEMVERFLRATLRGVLFAVADPEAASEHLLRRAPGLDPELNLRRLEAYNAVTSHGDRYPAGYMDREMFESTYERLEQEGVIREPFDVAEAYTTRFLEALHERDLD